MGRPRIDLSGNRVSNSRLKTWHRCQKQFEFKYIMDLEPKERKYVLELGSWMHRLLEEYYQGRDWRDTHKGMTKEFYNIFEELREPLGDLPSDALRLFRSYLRYWRDEDEHLVVIDAELDEIVTLPSGLEFRMIIDLIVEDTRTGLIWPWDHKNRKTFERSDNMLIDPQLTNYFTGLRVMGYEPLGGIVYNELRTKAPTVPRLLKNGELSKVKNIDTDVFTYYQAIKKNDLDPNKYADILRHLARNEPERFFRRVKLPKDPPMTRAMMREAEATAIEIRAKADDDHAIYTRTYDKRCSWDCDFKTLCIAQLHGGDLKSLIRHGYRGRKETDESEERK